MITYKAMISVTHQQFQFFAKRLTKETAAPTCNYVGILFTGDSVGGGRTTSCCTFMIWCHAGTSLKWSSSRKRQYDGTPEDDYHPV
ncbi:hypothetical protein EB796_013928 [Bugula neritina]|uniref:Uncharacterized protein n=1 Tax=Bugula neritina TaxID=10212 RepID=A0A7J7JQ47_BUGNE|nr:hypothetical protein EB796_013928 [Bugula neritina]